MQLVCSDVFRAEGLQQKRKRKISAADVFLVKSRDDICIGAYVELTFVVQLCSRELTTMGEASAGWNLGGVVFIAQTMGFARFE